jgi:hypothetical protein
VGPFGSVAWGVEDTYLASLLPALDLVTVRL